MTISGRVDDRDPEYWNLDTELQSLHMDFMGARLTWIDFQDRLNYILKIVDARVEEEKRYV